MTLTSGQLSLLSGFRLMQINRREVLKRSLSMDNPTPNDAISAIEDLWRADVDSGDMSAQTFARYLPLAKGFTRFCERRGRYTLEEALEDYELWLNAFGRDRSGRPAPSSLSTRHLRSCAVGALYRSARSLGWTEAHPPYVSREANETTKQGRPLVEPEFDTIRAVASTMHHSRHAAAIAIAISGGGTADLGNITIADVDLDDGAIQLPGARLISKRKVRIPGQWEYDVLAERIRDLRDFGHLTDTGLIVRRQGPEASRQAGAAIAIAEVLQRSQLKSDPSIKPASLSRWAALVSFETTGDISTAAALLGVKSLDTAASAIAWDWRSESARIAAPRPDYRPGVLP